MLKFKRKRKAVNIGILGNKIGMTQVFDKSGKLIPVTVIKAGPCYITNIKTEEKCGYKAIQIGYFEVTKNPKKLNKAYVSQFQKINLPIFKYLKEFKVENLDQYSIGQEIDLTSFEIGKEVKVSGLSIGKGNTGNVKGNGFSRGAMTHGSKHHRLQGSLGAGTSPGRVFPGKRMPGRKGGEKVSISGLEIIDFLHESQLLVLKGSVPGKTGNLLSIKLK